VKLVIQYLGKAFIFVAIVFVLVHSFVIISDGSVTKDLFGFVVPDRPPGQGGCLM